MPALKLTIVAGEQEGRRIAVAAGQTVTVGRLAEKNQLSVPDRYLAPVHFALRAQAGACTIHDVSQQLVKHARCERRCFVDALRNTGCGGGLCALHDLSGEAGIRLNGKKVTEAFLAEGDLIAAGATVFQVAAAQAVIEPVEPADAGAPLGLTLAQQERVLHFLRETPMPLFALLDAARAPRVMQLLLTHGEVYYSLYDGPEAERYAEVAPYLVELPPMSRLTEALVREHWGQSLGCFLFAQADFKSVRRQLRKFLLVEGEGAKKVYFRFYDPRVLRTFLPTCSAEECATFFGPIGHFVIEGEAPRTAWVFSRTSGGVRREVVRL
ncbi:MAG TPA: DUF4123 domain-containing protein [Polyangiaceae bacterium]|nr:DUF4123 domain-containing protein [Polyangiaceae bacterium]